MSRAGINEPHRPYGTAYGAPPQSGNYAWGAVVAIVLMAIAWSLVAWLIWMFVA